MPHGRGANEQQADESEKHAGAAPERWRHGFFDRFPYRSPAFNLPFCANALPVESEEDDGRERHDKHHGGEIGGERPDGDVKELRDDQSGGAGIGAGDERPQQDPGRAEDHEQYHAENADGCQTEHPQVPGQVAGNQFGHVGHA